jgi:3-oxoacyl-[acyl-carrier-protein] synthase II
MMKSSPLASWLRDDPIVITGIGAFSAAGADMSSLWDAAIAGRISATERIFGDGPELSRFAVCAAPAVDVTLPELRPFRKMDRCVQAAWLAAAAAWKQADIAGAYAPERIGLIVGTSRGPLVKRTENLDDRQNRRVSPSLAADTAYASVSGALAQAFKCKGPGATVSATCASAAFAIAFAAEQIVLGNADAMLVGGTEAPLQAAMLAQLKATGVLAVHEDPARACRPFDVDRTGLVLGEGSAFLILESERTSSARRIPALARLAGWATHVDDSGRAGVNPLGTGLMHVMRCALEIAGLRPDEIDYINAHGTGTRLNDAAEAQAVFGIFGGAVPCTSMKPITGHCLGATPALEAVVCVEALNRQLIPPTANCERQDPLCPINALPLKAQPAKLAAAMSNSVGFWGYCASLIFRAV